MKSNFKRAPIIYVLIILATLFLFSSLRGFISRSEDKQMTYTEVLAYFEDNKIKSYSLDFGTGTLIMKLREGGTAIKYPLPNISLFVNDVRPIIKEHNTANPNDKIEETFIPPAQAPYWVSMIPSIILIIGLGFMLFFLMRQARGGGNSPISFAKARAKTLEGRDKVTFDMVAGADEEKQELAEIVDFLKNPSIYDTLGARIPKGVLLMGRPGTGKTMLAKAVAGEADVPFYSISGSDFVEMFVGVGASRVRDLFDNAKKNAPSIIFIDEIDAVGRKRGAGLGGGHDEREQTLNQLLVEMDGFSANSGVIVIAATNRKDILDPALLRPGRFDRHITVMPPDVKGREEILKVHTRNKPMGPDVDLNVIAKTCGGFTGADLENLVNEAALGAARKAKKAITMHEIEEATLKVIIGPEKRSHKVLKKERHLTAIHEAGHAIVTFHCKTQDKVHQVSIIPRGGAGGFTLSLPEHDTMYTTRNEMYEMIVTLLGGRVAEAIMLDDISTGASNDLERCTKIAKAIVMRYGFTDKLGSMVYGKDEYEVFLGMDLQQDRGYSEEIAATIDKETRAIIDKAYAECEKILRDNIDKLSILADYLEVHDKINGENFEKLMRDEITTEELSAEADRIAQREKELAEEDRKRKEKQEQQRKAEKETESGGGNGAMPFPQTT